MRDGARIQASIELLERIDASLESGGRAADGIIATYLKGRRYIGSKDRREIQRHVYDVLRQRGLLIWALNEAGAVVSARAMMAAKLICLDGLELTALQEMFAGGYAPEGFSAAEQEILVKLPDLTIAPAWAKANLPEWALTRLQSRFGAAAADELNAMNSRAPLDLRLNPLKQAGADPLIPGEEVTRTPFAPLGLRLAPGTRVQNTRAYKSGAVEIQDEAAQIAASLCGASPGEQVIDFCAGAGGKALALATDMENKGQIYAFDADLNRMSPLRQRSQRAGVRTIQIVDDAAKLPSEADLVVCDVPCTGSGTWRRNPELRWRHSEEALALFQSRQLEILREASAHVKPGGRLAYMTCSIFCEEDEDVIDRFLENTDRFTLTNYRDLAGTLTRCPETASARPEMLFLTSHRHRTDGFFVAVLRRVD